mmetsp:Transcript_17962/g.56321  ORF Transcript_17962/g.56321 Transcript_17962/m.56321 type:complete len:370 (-) Transcript_17962:531-1640(-)
MGPPRDEAGRCRPQRGGPVWLAPAADLAGDDDDDSEQPSADRLYASRGPLTGDARLADAAHFERQLAALAPTRAAVREAMVYAIERADACRDVSRRLAAALARREISHEARLATLYVVSDILHNSAAPSRGARLYRALLRPLLPAAVAAFAAALARDAAAPRYAASLSALFSVWLAWSHVFPPMFVFGLELSFFDTLDDHPRPPEPYDPLDAADDRLLALRRDARLTGLDDADRAASPLARRLALLRRYVKHRTLAVEPAAALRAARADLHQAALLPEPEPAAGTGPGAGAGPPDDDDDRPPRDDDDHRDRQDDDRRPEAPDDLPDDDDRDDDDRDNRLDRSEDRPDDDGDRRHHRQQRDDDDDDFVDD